MRRFKLNHKKDTMIVIEDNGNFYYPDAVHINIVGLNNIVTAQYFNEEDVPTILRPFATETHHDPKRYNIYFKCTSDSDEVVVYCIDFNLDIGDIVQHQNGNIYKVIAFTREPIHTDNLIDSKHVIFGDTDETVVLSWIRDIDDICVTCGAPHGSIVYQDVKNNEKIFVRSRRNWFTPRRGEERFKKLY